MKNKFIKKKEYEMTLLKKLRKKSPKISRALEIETKITRQNEVCVTNRC